MTRIPPATRDMVSPEDLAAFNRVTFDKDRMHEGSPTGMMLNSPQACLHHSELKWYLRDRSTLLPSKVRELVMLVAAREMDSPDVWNLHAALGRQAGLSDKLVDALRDRTELPEMPVQEAVVIEYGRELFRQHRVTEATFQEALDQFGVQGLIELTMLMAFYVMPSFIAHAFEIEPPSDSHEPLMPA